MFFMIAAVVAVWWFYGRERDYTPRTYRSVIDLAVLLFVTVAASVWLL